MGGIQQYYFLGKRVQQRAHRAPHLACFHRIGLNGRSFSLYSVYCMCQSLGIWLVIWHMFKIIPRAFHYKGELLKGVFLNSAAIHSLKLK